SKARVPRSRITKFHTGFFSAWQGPLSEYHATEESNSQSIIRCVFMKHTTEARGKASTAVKRNWRCWIIERRVNAALKPQFENQRFNAQIAVNRHEAQPLRPVGCIEFSSQGIR